MWRRLGSNGTFLPVLASTCAAEVLEAVGWLEQPEDILETDEASCSRRNALASACIMVVGAFQPFLVLAAARGSATPSVATQLRVPEGLGLILGVSATAAFALGKAWGPGVRSVEESGRLGMHGLPDMLLPRAARCARRRSWCGVLFLP